MSKPVAGQWYENLGTRQHCIAVNDISCVMQWNCGDFEIVYAEDYDDLKHLPDCTGWDWQPETFPQYWTTLDTTKNGFAFVVRTSEHEWHGVGYDGKHCPTTLSHWHTQGGPYRKRLTEAEALALLDKPQPAEDPEEWVEITDPEHVVRECDQFNPDKGHPEGGWTACCGSVGVKRGTRPHLGFRCRRKDLPKPAKRTVSVPKWLVVYDDGDMEILDRTWAPTGNVHRVGETTYEID